MSVYQLVYFRQGEHILTQYLLVHRYRDALARVVRHHPMVNGIVHHLFEPLVDALGSIPFTPALQVLHEVCHHIFCKLVRLDTAFVDAICLIVIYKVMETLQGYLHHPYVFLRVVAYIGLEVVIEVHILVLHDAVARLTLFKLLFLLKPYLLRKCQCLAVQLLVGRFTGMRQQIEVKIFFLPMMRDLVF